MDLIYKCEECLRYFDYDEIDQKEICLEEELGVLGDFHGRTYKKVDCCPHCKSTDINELFEIESVSEVIEKLNFYTKHHFKRR